VKASGAVRPNVAWFAALPLLGWWLYGLFDLDEGYYGSVVSEMNRRGEWITPFFNGKPWFEKPILLYWLAKPSLALFGEMIGPRAPSVLATLATYAMVGWFAKRRLGADVQTPAVLILGGSLLTVLVGHMMLTDALLCASMTGALLTYWESIEGDWRWRWVTAAALGLGVLAKGPVAILLFTPIAAITAWRFKDLRPRMTQGWALGTLILALVVSSWYLPAYLIDGQLFVQKFLIEQNVGRFTGGDAAHNVTGVFGLVYYALILLIGMAPWSGWIPKTVLHKDPEPVFLFLKVWALTIFVFFTISAAKLPTYVLGCCPPFALLLGAKFAGKKRSLPWMVGWIVFLTILANAGALFWYKASGQAEIHALARFAREHAAPGDLFAEYQMSRRDKDMGTMKSKIQETSEPSVLMYLNSTAIDTDDWQQIVHQKSTVWLITRPNRMGEVETASAGSRLVRIRLGTPSENYVLYKLLPE
jgi:4-amino-4-deoxy-L-arabinose transferase-like glycosyltransferase